jgi:hypothetical protein
VSSPHRLLAASLALFATSAMAQQTTLPAPPASAAPALSVPGLPAPSAGGVTSQPWLPLLTPLIAGAFALGGAWFGASLSRRSEYHKWLRQARTEAFERFLRILNECEDRYYASNREIRGMPDLGERVSRVSALFQPTYNEARVTQLYLVNKDRHRLLISLQHLVDGHIGSGDVLKDSTKAKQALLDIQMLLEGSLGAP